VGGASVDPGDDPRPLDPGHETNPEGALEIQNRMSEDNDQTKPTPAEFDFSAFPGNTLFHERRDGRDRRKPPATDLENPARVAPPARTARVAKKERRRRIDPTTFEKQYTDDEMEFMNAMQRFKELSGKTFPTHGEVLRIAVSLGYRRLVVEHDMDSDAIEALDSTSSSLH
jgi:hypothetical protein